jgi:hypothetical protein
LFILPDFLSLASNKTDVVGFTQNWSGKPVKPIGLSVFYSVYQFSLKFSPIQILY